MLSCSEVRGKKYSPKGRPGSTPNKGPICQKIFCQIDVKIGVQPFDPPESCVLLSNYTMDYELTFWFVSKCNTHLAETKTNNYRIIFLEFFRYGNFVTQYLSISWCEYVLHFIYYAFLTTHRHVGKYWDRINLTDDWVYYRSFLSVPDQPQFTVCLYIVI